MIMRFTTAVTSIIYLIFLLLPDTVLSFTPINPTGSKNRNGNIQNDNINHLNAIYLPTQEKNYQLDQHSSAQEQGRCPFGFDRIGRNNFNDNPIFYGLQQSKHQLDRNYLPPIVPDNFCSSYLKFQSNKCHSWLLQSMRKVKSNVFRLPLNNMVIVGDAKIARAILNNPNTKKEKAMHRNIEITNTKGLPTFLSVTDNADQRSLHARRSFATGMADKTLMKQTSAKVLKQWIKSALEQRLNNQNQKIMIDLDISNEMKKLAVQGVSMFAMDCNISDQQANDFAQGIHTSFEELQATNVNPLRKYIRFLLPQWKKACKARDTCLDVVQHIIDHYQSQGDQARRGTVIDAIMKDEKYNSELERKFDIMLFLMAGFDTTASVLSFALYELAKNPQYQSELRNNLSDLTSHDEVANHPMVKNLVKETHRMYSSLSLVFPRIADGDIQVDSPSSLTSSKKTVIPKGTTTIVSPYLVHRNENIFPQPDLFDPNRWNQASKQMNECMMQYSTGPRACIGRSLAEVELHTFIGNLIKEYEFTIIEEPEESFLFTLHPTNLRLGVKKIV